jgi:hypothetical protein
MNTLNTLAKWERHIKESEATKHSLLPLLGSDSPVLTCISKLQDALTTAVTLELRDEDDWLFWYWQDNQLGARAGRVSMDTYGVREVRTIEDLAVVMNTVGRVKVLDV